MVLVLTEKLHDEELPRNELEDLLANKGYWRHPSEVCEGGIIDNTRTPSNTYKGNWSIHKHKDHPDQYIAL